MRNWELNRQDEIRSLQARGIIPLYDEMERLEKVDGVTEEIEDQSTMRPMGIVAGLVNTPGQTAAEIVAEMVAGATRVLGSAGGFLKVGAKL